MQYHQKRTGERNKAGQYQAVENTFQNPPFFFFCLLIRGCTTNVSLPVVSYLSIIALSSLHSRPSCSYKNTHECLRDGNAFAWARSLKKLARTRLDVRRDPPQKKKKILGGLYPYHISHLLLFPPLSVFSPLPLYLSIIAALTTSWGLGFTGLDYVLSGVTVACIAVES